MENTGYYRLTAYFLPFKTADGNYSDGTDFFSVYIIYEFDRKLRNLLYSAIEEVEVCLRSRFSYYHAHKYGAAGYLDASNFSDKHNAQKFEEKISREIENNKTVLFVKHHLNNYGGVFPVWVITELFTFGMLSYFYADMIRQDQKALAKVLYNTTPKSLISWLRCCTDLRNICAHYGRLYFRIFPAIPAGLNLPDGAQRRLWGAVLALRALYLDSEKWNTHFLPAIEALFEEYSTVIDLNHIGFPSDWAVELRK